MVMPASYQNAVLRADRSGEKSRHDEEAPTPSPASSRVGFQGVEYAGSLRAHGTRGGLPESGEHTRTSSARIIHLRASFEPA